MAIPAPSDDVSQQRQSFAAVRECFVGIKAKHSNDVGYDFFDTLSMGMSDDMEAAVAEGSTMVRIGSAIFGKRDKIKAWAHNRQTKMPTSPSLGVAIWAVL